MKTIFLMYLLIIPVCLQAQIEQYTRVLEPSVLVCQYECVKKVDTLGTDLYLFQRKYRIFDIKEWL